MHTSPSTLGERWRVRRVGTQGRSEVHAPCLGTGPCGAASRLCQAEAQSQSRPPQHPAHLLRAGGVGGQRAARQRARARALAYLVPPSQRGSLAALLAARRCRSKTQ